MHDVIAVVIPCFRVRRHILGVLARIGPECDSIYVVDDCCPEQTGDWVQQSCTDERIRVIRNETNLGVGGAVIAGYRRAIADGASIIVKIDGDGQMPPELLPQFIAPIVTGQADYTKGNRFYDLSNISRMPRSRIAGNAVLSFLAKASTGYWNVFDPANGYTAIDARVAARLPLSKISKTFFFETDMLFRLGTMRAVVIDVPMDSVYGDEESNLHISRILREFIGKHTRNAVKRVFYSYFLREVSLASFELVLGAALVLFAIVFGVPNWVESFQSRVPAPAGTVMLAALPALLGVQLLLGFISFDISATPRNAINPHLPPWLLRSRGTHAGAVGEEQAVRVIADAGTRARP